MQYRTQPFVSFCVVTLLFVFTLTPASPPQAALPPDAAQALRKLPNQQLSMDLVLAKALASSDSFRAVSSKKQSIESDREQALTPLGVQLYASGTRAENKNKEGSVFDATETKTLSIGASKYFRSGTLFSGEISDSQSLLPAGNTFQPENRTTTKIKLVQNLWKDSFGYFIRSQAAAGELSSAASALEYQKATEDWAVDLIQVYYVAWLAKAQLAATKTGLDRRKRLLDITRLKLNRGTAERPDYLQVESAWLDSKATYEQAAHDLQEMWRELVTTLKLPIQWIHLPAELIPLALDQPTPEAVRICSSRSQATSPPTITLNEKIWKARAQASELKLAASKNAKNPELNLFGSYATGGSLGTASERMDSALSSQNPEWLMGLEFKMPLEWHAEKAQLGRDAAMYQQSQALYSKARSDGFNGWINGCAKLKTLTETFQAHEKAARNLAERAALEERRFQTGRTPTLNVILAGDDQSGAELKMNQSKIQLNRAAWEILKLDGQIESYLQQASNRFQNIEL
jgi:outer membrane protein TolC